jgi:hypothetical protein
MHLLKPFYKKDILITQIVEYKNNHGRKLLKKPKHYGNHQKKMNKNSKQMKRTIKWRKKRTYCF